MRRMIIGIGTMAVLLGLVLAGVQLGKPKPRTAREAISMVLQQRGVAFDDLRVEYGRCLPTPEQCDEYRADVVVVARQPLRGLMQCWEFDRKCELWIADLGIDMSLPDLELPQAWLEWIKRLANDTAGQVREVLQRSFRP